MKFSQIIRQAVLMTVLPIASTLQAVPNENNYSIPIQDEVIKIVTAEEDVFTNDKNSEVSLQKSAKGYEEPFFYPQNYLCFTAESSGATITLKRDGYPREVNLEYSTFRDMWLKYEISKTITLPEKGSKVYFRAQFKEDSYGESGVFSKDKSNYYYFSITGSIAASGNIMSLVDYHCRETKVADYAFYGLFSNQTLTSAPALPATELGEGCYGAMFWGCEELTKAPELPATKLPKECYDYMFFECTKLQQGPTSIPATHVDYYSCGSMFSGCTSLLKAPELPATELAYGCYNNMFYGCSSLEKAPTVLPATKLAPTCYHEMFFKCTSLTATPKILATELAERCCEAMFFGCTSLTKAYELPATKLTYESYRCMFKGCSSLKKISVKFTEWMDNGMGTLLWLDGVAEDGVFECPKELKELRGQNHIPEGWLVNPDYLCFTSEEEDDLAAVELVYSGETPEVSLEYSTDHDTWYEYEPGETGEIVLHHKGDKVWFKAKTANSKFSKDYSNYYHFNIYNHVAASGNIMSLLDPTCQRTTVPSYAFYRLFAACRSLTQAPILPATQVGSRSYEQMFTFCESLNKAPELPATKLNAACYSYMFLGTNIKEAPALPATKLAGFCYRGMFDGCKSLIKAPELPATQLRSYCYNFMFSGCSSLTCAPYLPASELVDDCYSGMFYECSSLQAIKVNFSEWTSKPSATDDWMKGVAQNGIFICPDNLSKERGTSNIPWSWKIIPEDNSMERKGQDSETIFDLIHQDDNHRFDDIITNGETHTISGETTKDKQGLVVKDGKVVLIKK